MLLAVVNQIVGPTAPVKVDADLHGGSTGLTIALISAGAALLGALIGGGIGLLGDVLLHRRVQHDEHERELNRMRTAAREVFSELILLAGIMRSTGASDDGHVLRAHFPLDTSKWQAFSTEIAAGDDQPWRITMNAYQSLRVFEGYVEPLLDFIAVDQTTRTNVQHEANDTDRRLRVAIEALRPLTTLSTKTDPVLDGPEGIDTGAQKPHDDENQL